VNQLPTLLTSGLRALGLAVLVSAFWPVVALAQTAPAASAISLGAPTAATLGQTVTLQAHLIDAQGAPIAAVPVYFVVPLSFLNVDGDAVVAQGRTNSDGLVAAIWQVRSSGTLGISAEFRGDENHGPSAASSQMTVTGNQQLYVDDQGVLVPGLSTAPIPALAALWPRLTPWPIVLALVIVWSLYGRVAFLLFQLVRQSGAEQPTVPKEERL
jgi:hypothetical protein